MTQDTQNIQPEQTPWVPGWTGDEIESYEESLKDEFMKDKMILVTQIQDVN